MPQVWIICRSANATSFRSNTAGISKTQFETGFLKERRIKSRRIIAEMEFMNALSDDSHDHGGDQKYDCVRLDLPGQLFDPLSENAVECTVVRLSPDGAGVLCRSDYKTGMKLILHMNTFGRFEGAVVPQLPDANRCFALAFSLRPSKRDRVAEMISQFAREGLVGVTELRKSRRIRTNGSVDMVLEDGQSLTCELVDISLEGVALRTQARPPLGDLVRLGQARGRVARYHDEGISIRFIRTNTGGGIDGMASQMRADAMGTSALSAGNQHR